MTSNWRNRDEEDGAEKEIGEGDVDSVDHACTLRRKFVDVVSTCVPQWIKDYKKTVRTAPLRDLRSMYRMELWMQPSFEDPRLSTVVGLLR